MSAPPAAAHRPKVNPARHRPAPRADFFERSCDARGTNKVSRGLAAATAHRAPAALIWRPCSRPGDTRATLIWIPVRALRWREVPRASGNSACMLPRRPCQSVRCRAVVFWPQMGKRPVSDEHGRPHAVPSFPESGRSTDRPAARDFPISQCYVARPSCSVASCPVVQYLWSLGHRDRMSMSAPHSAFGSSMRIA